VWAELDATYRAGTSTSAVHTVYITVCPVRIWKAGN